MLHFLGKQLRKLPRLTNSNIITIKRPETIRAKSNGRMGFAPLFEEERRQKMKMLKQVVKIMKNKEQINRPRKFYRDIFIIYFVKVLCKF